MSSTSAGEIGASSEWPSIERCGARTCTGAGRCGAEPMSERALRAVAHAGSWLEQRGAWAGVRSKATAAPLR